jgi:uridine kinase
MQTRIVAIDGCGGAGKSSLAAKLAALLDDCPLIHTDDFASWDHPLDWYPRMITQVLEPLRQNRPTRYQKFDWQKNQLGEWETVEPCPVVLVEGVSASRVEFRPYLSFAIFVETDRELRLQRGLERDGEEALPLWQQWMAEEDEYLLRDRPEEYADVVISGNTGDLWRINSSC